MKKTKLSNHHQCLLALLITSVFVGCSQPRLTTKDLGDGKLISKSWPSYHPRYTVELPAIRDLEATTKTYVLDSLPSAEYELILAIEHRGMDSIDWGAWKGIWDRLHERQVAIEIRFEKADGQQIKEVIRAVLADDCTPGPYGGSKFVLRHDGLEVELEGKIAIFIEITADERGSASLDGLAVQPMLIGGGFEL